MWGGATGGLGDPSHSYKRANARLAQQDFGRELARLDGFGISRLDLLVAFRAGVQPLAAKNVQERFLGRFAALLLGVFAGEKLLDLATVHVAVVFELLALPLVVLADGVVDGFADV